MGTDVVSNAIVQLRHFVEILKYSNSDISTITLSKFKSLYAFGRYRVYILTACIVPIINHEEVAVNVKWGTAIITLFLILRPRVGCLERLTLRWVP